MNSNSVCKSLQVKRVRSASTLNPPESSREALVVFDESKTQHFQQRQMQMQEDDVDVQALLERERAIRQLEVLNLLRPLKISVTFNL